MKHTQGPWYQRSQGSEIEIKSGIYTIAMVHNYNEHHQVNEANAKPYRSCTGIIGGFSRPVLLCWCAYGESHVYKVARAAIAKATGEKEITS
jgi:hypothetical protein